MGGGEIRSARRGAPHSRFSVEGLPESRKFDVWRQSISCIFDVERTRTQAQEEGFRATLESYALGPVMLAHSSTLAQKWSRSALTAARDGMDHFMVQTYVKGSQRLDWRGGSLDMPRQGLLVYDLSREMSAISTDLSNISLIVARPLVEDLLIAPDGHHMRALDGGHPMTALLLDHMMALWRHARGMAEPQAAELAPATAHLLAACLNMAADAGGARPEDRTALDGAVLRMARREVEKRLNDPTLDADDLCRRLGLSRTRLYAMFAPFGGVASYIRDRRLRAAMAALVDPARTHLPVGAIGAALGFSASEFSRAFQRRYGMSPRAARHYGAAPSGPPRAAGPDRRYETWLRQLSA